MPRKEFNLNCLKNPVVPLKLPANLTVMNCLDRVLRLLHVGSKRFLTNKVDRCVTGLIVQQQCVGPIHTPLADYAIVAVSHLGNVSYPLFNTVCVGIIYEQKFN